MVDSGGREGPLSLRTEGSRNANKQRYNVAVSRAKDQLWLVHSLDYSIDLKPGDIRRGLLEYVENPSAFALVEEKIKNKSDSYFEEKVAKSLFAAGYNISQQWKVGSYRIDIVVQYKDRKIALECDGERYHSSPEQVQNDWERQKLLERMGWKFIRIRGSEYFRNPEKAMKRVFEELKEYEIFQETALEERQEENNSDLLERVKIRANQILMNWDNEEKIDDWNINFEESRDNASRGRELGETSGGNTNKPINNSEDIVEFLKEEGIAFVDQRERSGIIWVLYSDKLKDKFKNRAENSGHRFSFEARGSLSTAGKPAWRIMVS